METSNSSWITNIGHWLQQSSSHVSAETESSLPSALQERVDFRDAAGGSALASGGAGQYVQAIAAAPPEELELVVEVLVASCRQPLTQPTRLRLTLQALASRLLKTLAEADEDVLESLRDRPLIGPVALTNLYYGSSEIDAVSSAHALQMLAAQPDEESIDLLAGILTEKPPADWKHLAVGISPLWRAEPQQIAFLFERLDCDNLNPATLPILIDLANYSLRKGKLTEHPWQTRQADLAGLLSNVCDRLRTLQLEPAKFGSDVSQVQRVLNDSVSLTISLCDTLGLIGIESNATDALQRAMELAHRRIQVEAAGALARLGVAAGKQRLVELAQDPVARLRAVHYAEELGCVEQIEEAFRLPVALAEAELVSWLASAEQFAIAPHRVELLDTRTQYWPGYDQPQDCFLFRYEYDLPTGSMSNIGLAGPATHAFTADLTPLPVDDIYAVFAGWQAEHEDIFELPMTQLNIAQRREADRLLEVLEAEQLQVEEAVALTFFLGEVAVLAIATGERGKCCAITDGLETLKFQLQGGSAALTPAIVLALYRGRKLLRTFNLEYS